MSEKNVNQSTTGGEKHCKKCDRADIEDNMVCCDVCEAWVHFQCAGVTDSIGEPDRSWKCSACLADWNGSSKSEVSFNESSVSKSSRVSVRLHLSLQLLEEEQKLKKKRAEEELKIRRLEEEAKLKAMDEEQEYLRKKYELLMQIGDEKDSSTRKSGVSVRSRRDQLEKWLTKGSIAARGGQPIVSQTVTTLPLPIIGSSQTGAKTVPPSMNSETEKIGNPSVTLNQGMLYVDPTIPVQGGSVTALAQSYELLATTAVSVGAPTSLPSAPMITVSTASKVVTTSTGTVPDFVPSINSTIQKTNGFGVPQFSVPDIATGYAYPGMNIKSSAALSMPLNTQVFNGTPSRGFCPIPSNPAHVLGVTQPVMPSTSSFQYSAASEAAVSRNPLSRHPAIPEAAGLTSSSLRPIPSIFEASITEFFLWRKHQIQI